MIRCDSKIKREEDFKPHPKFKNTTNLDGFYINSGYDRGHMFPAADGSCDSQVMKESFYYTNIAPQTPQLNRGDWKIVEELSRLEALEHDSVLVWAGNIGEFGRIGSVAIPVRCWKVVYVKKTKEWFAFIFNNTFTLSNGISDNIVSLRKLETITGYKFKIESHGK